MERFILVVDDDEDDCRMVQESLRQIGVKIPVRFVYGGFECFELLDEPSANLPILIILDVNLPRMNGLEVLEQLNIKFKIPVIFYTTSCNEDLLVKARKLGAIDCVQKGTSYADNLKFAKRIKELATQGL
jgi:CheY-like chemotaxis protein